MSQTQLPPTRSARLALGFSDPVPVDVAEEDLGRPWREVALEALAESEAPTESRLHDILGAPAEFQFERGGEYLSPDSSTRRVLGLDADASHDQGQDSEPLVRVMRRQRGGAGFTARGFAA